ncbi:hypothetical protein [Pseudorhodobacter sp.]|uniref:hypothetical protein n=1 Tax=Pseudorhodobacter sp. TaxID=1934400 RepID=UPI002648C0AC|nr:hypothetical protein [Pseudorhodobacter sp.]MDN5787962.1 hypothetical protein [Pseudorhodobacter sp.]
MKARLIATILLFLLSLPANAFSARNGMTVLGRDGTDFTVAFDSVPRETDYLCAAGDFLIAALGLPSKTRFYRASPPPRKQGQGISFTTDPARKVKMGLFTSFGNGAQDGGISAGAATGSYCEFLMWLPFE